MALGSGMYLVAVFATAMSLVTLYFLSFIEDKIQGRRSYSYALVVTDLNQALASINKVLQDSSVAAASFNFKKRPDIIASGLTFLFRAKPTLKSFSASRKYRRSSRSKPAVARVISPPCCPANPAQENPSDDSVRQDSRARK